MQQVTISGTLLEDAETLFDKKGLNYTRFTVTCGETESDGRPVFTHYHCVCYIKGYETLKKKDQVFVSGKQTIKILKTKETNEPYPYISVLVTSISRGYTAKERNKR